MAKSATQHSTHKIFLWSYIVAGVALVVAYIYAGWPGVVLAAILGVLEVSLSFDNAVINSTVLERMNDFWQRIFLTIGILIAVVGMRLVLPLLVVYLTSGLSPVGTFQLAMNPPADGAAYFPDGSPSYGTLLTAAHPMIAAFGGMFLLMLFLNWLFEERETQWLVWIENMLGKGRRVESMAVIICLVAVVTASIFAENPLEVLYAGAFGLITYLAVNGVGGFFQTAEGVETEDGDPQPSGNTQLVKVVGKAAFFLFLYLEVLDASFSFDGVIGAFAITSDPILIALGLGLIGAMFVRSLTVFLVRKGTLQEYVYLEHGAHWAIAALAIILLMSIRIDVSQYITGLIGVFFIGASLWSSILRNKRMRRAKFLAAATGGTVVQFPSSVNNETFDENVG